MFLEVKNTNGSRCLINTNQITSIIETDNNTTLITLVYCDSVVTPTQYSNIIHAISRCEAFEVVSNSRKEG